MRVREEEPGMMTMTMTCLALEGFEIFGDVNDPQELDPAHSEYLHLQTYRGQLC